MRVNVANSALVRTGRSIKCGDRQACKARFKLYVRSLCDLTDRLLGNAEMLGDGAAGLVLGEESRHLPRAFRALCEERVVGRERRLSVVVCVASISDDPNGDVSALGLNDGLAGASERFATARARGGAEFCRAHTDDRGQAGAGGS
jgi:hypothetical protein